MTHENKSGHKEEGKKLPETLPPPSVCDKNFHHPI